MILLDTHVLIWYVGQPKLISSKAKQLIESSVKKKQILVSSISIWEICLLVQKDRLKLSMDLESFISRVESLPFLKFVPVDNAIATKSVLLPPPLHADPADRIIIATALTEGATLVTADKQILKYPHVKSVW
jgi:PIN domain nuclease of toxin-antitoxin system